MCVKEKVIELIKNLPDKVTFEDIQYHLYVLEKISNAEKDIEKGKLLTMEEVKKRIDRWLIK